MSDPMYPAGVTDAHDHFTDTTESDEVEARRLLCGCVELSNGEMSFCFEHEPEYEYGDGEAQ